MYCNKCGNEINPNQKYCNKCGSRIENITQNTYNQQYNSTQYNMKESWINKTNIIIIAVTVVIIFVIIGITNFFVKIFEDASNYYFYEDSANKEPNTEVQSTTNTKASTKGKYKTSIITDNVYSGINVRTVEDAQKLIREDSVSQKQVDYPKEIIKIENDIIQKYSITAVNLKEMDVDFARELENVIKNIYMEYPGARGYLTNLSLTNLNMSEAGVIALFRPIFVFGTSDTSTTRPWVIKTQVHLNSKYFLNPERIDSSVETGSKLGHFPKNATRYSPVAHELGHYLSFIALLKHYNMNSLVLVNDMQEITYYEIFKDFAIGTFSKTMLDEAYGYYTRDYGYMDFDEWRGQISGYALAKDECGDYIYDETIAEAFHDVYLNGNNANLVSQYIVYILKMHIEG